jgi:hypothetical protein
LNFFKAQLLSSTIWCHRYSELIEQYINKYLNKAIHLLKTNWDSKADYFVLRDKKAIKLTSYLSSEGNYEVSCQRPDIIQERILTSIKDVQSVNDSYNEMINFLKLIEREEELLVSLQFSSYT